MGIDETGHYDAMTGIDHFTIAADQTFDFAPPADASMNSPRTSIAPSSIIASCRKSPPVRGRLGPASVTSCEQLMMARVSATDETLRFLVEGRAHENPRLGTQLCPRPESSE